MTLHEPIVADATLEPMQTAHVAAPAAARVTKIGSEVAQHVKQGDTLAELDARSEQIALSEAQHKLVDARRRSQAAGQQLPEVELAQDEVTKAELARDQMWVRSPIDGIVIERRVEVGDTPASGATIFVVGANPKLLVAHLHLAARDLARIANPFHGARVTVDGVAYRGFSAGVQHVAPAASPDGTFDVTVLVTNDEDPNSGDERLRFGMVGHVTFEGPPHDAVVIPRAALDFGPAPEMVWIVDTGKLVARRVRVGRTFEDQVDVVGIAPGEQVAVPHESR